MKLIIVWKKTILHWSNRGRKKKLKKLQKNKSLNNIVWSAEYRSFVSISGCGNLFLHLLKQPYGPLTETSRKPHGNGEISMPTHVESVGAQTWRAHRQSDLMCHTTQWKWSCRQPINRVPRWPIMVGVNSSITHLRTFVSPELSSRRAAPKQQKHTFENGYWLYVSNVCFLVDTHI